MSAKDYSSRGSPRRGGIGSYGNYPWDASYDHMSFLSEMVPVSFQDRDGGKDGGFSGLTDEMLMKGITPFPVVHGGLAEAGSVGGLKPAKAGVHG